LFRGRSVGAPLFGGKGAPTRVNFIYFKERFRLFVFNGKRRKGASLLFRPEGFSFVSEEEVSNDISFFVF
jgi:hypothetical protein